MEKTLADLIEDLIRTTIALSLIAPDGNLDAHIFYANKIAEIKEQINNYG